MNTKLADIKTINQRLVVIRDQSSFSDLITIAQNNITNIKAKVDSITNKKYDDFYTILPRITNGLLGATSKVIDKVKIPHGENINDVYSIWRGKSIGTSQNNISNVTAEVKGSYRLTLVGQIQFNISSSASTGVNITSAIIEKEATKRFTLTPVTSNLAGASTTISIMSSNPEFSVDFGNTNSGKKISLTQSGVDYGWLFVT